MKDTEYKKLIELTWVGGGYIPTNQNAIELSETHTKGEIVNFKEITARDLKRHRCYFSLLNFIYSYLPSNFKKAVSEDKFYQWLKHLKGEYKVLFQFKDGTTFVEYDSISFAMMSENEFRAYVKNQLPFIYSDVIGAFFEGQIYDNIIETIEGEYEKFMIRL